MNIRWLKGGSKTFIVYSQYKDKNGDKMLEVSLPPFNRLTPVNQE